MSLLPSSGATRDEGPSSDTACVSSAVCADTSVVVRLSLHRAMVDVSGSSSESSCCKRRSGHTH
eukprot:3071353-Pleurochrysis_carterae.AAC.2